MTTNDEYFVNLCEFRTARGMSWQDVADEMNHLEGVIRHKDTYRKRYAKLLAETDNSVVELDEIKVEKLKLQDQKTQINALYRRISREDTLLEIALACCDDITNKIKLESPSIQLSPNENSKYEGILEISDWHYGIEVDNFWNVYNPDIAKKRVEKLRDSVIEYIVDNDITHLHIVSLGDMIAGRIHLTLRLNSRFDVITQIIQVSEIMAEFVNDLSEYAYIDYYDTLDNHSRLEPNIKDSLDLESLARIIPWYMKLRLESNKNVRINNNSMCDDIIQFESMGHKVAGVHGHKDKPQKIISNMSLMTQEHYDLILTAHYHHFYADEENMTMLVGNGSLMGTDDYAEKLRLTSNPTQNLILVTQDNPCACIYRIKL